MTDVHTGERSLSAVWFCVGVLCSVVSCTATSCSLPNIAVCTKGGVRRLFYLCLGVCFPSFLVNRADAEQRKAVVWMIVSVQCCLGGSMLSFRSRVGETLTLMETRHVLKMT